MPTIDTTTPTGIQPNGFSSGFTLTMSDEFNSSTPDSKWFIFRDFGDATKPSGNWDINANGNSALRMWWNGNTATDNVTFASNGNNPFRQRYGFFEAKCKCASGKGFFPAFWLITMPVNNSTNTGSDGAQPELDIVEWFSYENGDWLVDTTNYRCKNMGFTIWTEGGGGSMTQGGHFALSPNYNTTLSTQYHTYGMHWTVSGGLKFYFDGVLKYSMADPWGSSSSVSSQTYPVILELWWGPNGGNPTPTASSTPTTASDSTSFLVDYVRVWSIGAGPATWRIMPLGDSVTEGQSSTANYRDSLADLLINNSISASFVGSMSTNTTGLPTNYQKHEGHSGWCSTDAGGVCQQGNSSWDPSRPIGILERIDTWLSNNPVNMVLLMCGINDGSSSTLQSALSQIIDKILLANAGTKILVGKIRTTGNAQTTKNNAIVAACSGKTNTTVVETYANWNDSTMMNADGLHPNTTGYQQMAQNWFAAIQDAIAPGNVFNASVTQAPADGATISGFVTFEVSGDLIENVELLPPTGYTPKYGSFTINAAKTVATLTFDTSAYPNGSFSARISAFDQPSGSSNPTEEIVAMTTRTWTIANDVVVMPIITTFDQC